MSFPPKKQKRFEQELKKPRVKYDSEEKYKWLVDLLDSYHLIDIGVKIELESQEKLTKRKVVCQKGCSACCSNPNVLINEIELRGLTWYMSEIVEEEVYNRLSLQLINHEQTTACCFLLDGACSIYPVRPIACRIFYVYDTPCENLEDVAITRPKDIAHAHKKEIAWMVSKKLMPHLGIIERKEQMRLFGEGYMFNNTRSLHEFDWKEFKTNIDKIRLLLSERQ